MTKTKFMTEQNSSLLELELDDMTSGILKEAAKWSRYIVITFYVCCALIVFGMLGLLMAGDTFIQAMETSLGEVAGTAGLVMIMIVFLIVTAIVGLLAFLLGKFSSKVKQGVEQNNQHLISEGIAGLKNYLTITGVMGVLGLLVSLIQLFTVLGR